MTLERVTSIIESFRGRRIAVLGDLMLDRYVWGRASRISQEAPVPVVAVERTTATTGGAANVLCNLVALGATPSAFGVVGDDDAGTELMSILGGMSVDTTGIVRTEERRTTEKTRVLAGNQQVVRVDRESTRPLGAGLSAILVDRIGAACTGGQIEGIIAEDYGKGTLDGELLSRVLSMARETGIPVALDPHPGNAFDVKGLTVLTPNRAEAFALAGSYYVEGREPIEEDTALRNVVEILESRWAPEHLLITLGAAGMALFNEQDPALHVPTKAQEVFDVSGAGDTVVATFMLARVSGAGPEESATMANHAAGVVVGKVGTATVEPEELFDSFRADLQVP